MLMGFVAVISIVHSTSTDEKTTIIAAAVARSVVGGEFRGGLGGNP